MSVAHEKKLVAEYYSSLGVTFRYLAAALGIPFMPMKSMLGSDLLKRIEEETGPDNVREMDDPFTGGLVSATSTPATSRSRYVLELPPPRLICRTHGMNRYSRRIAPRGSRRI